MRRLMLYFPLVFLAALVGCGGGSDLPYTDHSKDPEAYARNVKALVLGVAADAKTSREPADDLASIVTELEQKDRPRGSYGPIYDELLTNARTLQEECARASGRPSGLDRRLDELAKIAQQLPGEATVGRATDD